MCRQQAHAHQGSFGDGRGAVQFDTGFESELLNSQRISGLAGIDASLYRVAETDMNLAQRVLETLQVLVEPGQVLGLLDATQLFMGVGIHVHHLLKNHRQWHDIQGLGFIVALGGVEQPVQQAVAGRDQFTGAGPATLDGPQQGETTAHQIVDVALQYCLVHRVVTERPADKDHAGRALDIADDRPLHINAAKGVGVWQVVVEQGGVDGERIYLGAVVAQQDHRVLPGQLTQLLHLLGFDSDIPVIAAGINIAAQTNQQVQAQWRRFGHQLLNVGAGLRHQFPGRFAAAGGDAFQVLAELGVLQ